MIKHKVEHNGKLYAMLVSPEVKGVNTTEWFGKEVESLQGSLMCYDGPKDFKNHKHKLNPRIINRTQECFVVVRGTVKVDIYDENTKQILATLKAQQHEIIFVWRGYHHVEFQEAGTIAYEIKAGSFNGVVEDDKEFFE